MHKNFIWIILILYIRSVNVYQLLNYSQFQTLLYSAYDTGSGTPNISLPAAPWVKNCWERVVEGDQQVSRRKEHNLAPPFWLLLSLPSLHLIHKPEKKTNKAHLSLKGHLGGSVKHPTLDLSSGLDLRLLSLSPALGSTLGMELTSKVSK